VCSRCGLKDRLGAAKRWMLSLAEPPFSVLPLRPLVPLDMGADGTAEAIVIESLELYKVVGEDGRAGKVDESVTESRELS